MGLTYPSVDLQWYHQSQLPCVAQNPLGQGSLHALRHQPIQIPQNLHHHSRIKKLLIHQKETQVKRITSLIFDKLLTSIYFLALSHAPPVLEADIAIC